MPNDLLSCFLLDLTTSARAPLGAAKLVSLVQRVVVDERLHVAAADLRASAGDVGDATAHRAERRRVVLVLQINVAVAHRAGATVAAVKLRLVVLVVLNV